MTALMHASSAGKAVRMFLKALFRLSGKKIIYLDLPFIRGDSFSIYRPSHEAPSRQLIQIEELIKGLDPRKYFILSSTRSMQGLTYNKFSQDVCFSRLHWSILVSCADLVIFTDSSIGLETLRLGIPVLKYRSKACIADDLFEFTTNVAPGFSNVSDPTHIDDAIRESLRCGSNEIFSSKSVADILSKPDYRDIVALLRL